MPENFRTEVRIGYDDRNVYVAFHCFDNEPDKIRTNVSRRDSCSATTDRDEPDSAGTGQSAYHLFSNPSGSQMDAINTSASGEQFDADIVWYSVANTTSDGYVVEIQVPLQTLRFKGGDTVRMGLVFFRKISRTGVSYAWPEMLPGQWVFDRPSHITFSNLKPRRLVEVLPSVTYGVRQERESSAPSWGAVDNDTHVGASGKFGITSGVTLDATVNPDFSQVESDAFQITVNQRFPNFFSEKRPFFMEGMGLFNIARQQLHRGHTRRIIGSDFRRQADGHDRQDHLRVLNALDDHRATSATAAMNTPNIRNKMFTIGRVDVCVATRRLHRRDRHANKSRGPQQLRDRRGLPSSGRRRRSRWPECSPTTRTSDSRPTRKAIPRLTYQFREPALRGDRARRALRSRFSDGHGVLLRTGFPPPAELRPGQLFYPRSGQNFWIHRISPFVFAKAGHDGSRTATRISSTPASASTSPARATSVIEISRGKEAWKGQEYRIGNDVFMFANMQVVRWLSLFGGGGIGPGIYYDDVDPFQGRSLFSFFGFELQPNQHITQSVEGNVSRLDRESTGERIYDVMVLNSKTTYQFDKHFLVRFIANYDSSAHRVLTDFLASYEFVPGTVVHAGYGSLYERGSARAIPNDANSPVRLEENYRATNRGLFFKASYLRRF
jgi:hypothetical protein